MSIELRLLITALVPFVLYQYYFIFKEDSSISCSTVLVMWDKEDFYTVTERNFMNLDIRGWLTKDNRLFRIFKIYLVFDFWLVGFIVFIANNISVIQMYRGGQFYWWRKPECTEKTIDLPQVTDKRNHILVVIGTDCKGILVSCGHYHDGPL